MAEPKQSNYSVTTGEFTNMEKPGRPSKMGFWETVSVIKKVFFESGSRVPGTRLPELKPDLKAFLEPERSLKFIWFGHSTILLNLDGQRILIDPVFSDTASPVSFLVKRFQSSVLKVEELPEIDVILISHDHYDHLDKKTIKKFRGSRTTFLVPLGVGQHLRDWGIEPQQIRELNWGESTLEKGILYTAAPAQHFSGRGLFDGNKTLWASWAIKGSEENIFYSGDSGYGKHFKEIGDRLGPFDYAFIEDGQYDKRWPDVHMQPEESIQAMMDVNAHTLIPVHWGMFDLSLHHWSEPIIRTHKFAKDWHIPILTPRLGEVVHAASHRNVSWWEGVTQTEPAPPLKFESAFVREIPVK